MKKIHFNHLRFKHWSTFVILLAFLCIVFGFFEIVAFTNPEINKKVSALGYILTAIYYSKMFWYRNYVEWNKLGMNIKLNKWISKSISFDEVSEVLLTDSTLTIIEKSGFKKNFQIDTINSEDVAKLIRIINENAGIQNSTAAI
ncbi:hypothetical protein H8R23_03885 [Flavobacterium sp. F-380]|uniref:PH domain-containing protein n=1 Tax=Flavobacterium kayseriense TaxID=2764714 RepID=A0ABR7J4R9_9FLAO|nr:hypothetical protein [Flavobacterium kayseriense]MBC5840536.1 hypothetical protein [Flavobacterium kayseriense]MBC5846794.1 hypothetical protein [Flavobacterium kayseriense]